MIDTNEKLLFSSAEFVRGRFTTRSSDWGGWRREGQKLVHPDGGVHPLDREQFMRSAWMLDRIAQAARKPWATDTCIAGLVRALNALRLKVYVAGAVFDDGDHDTLAQWRYSIFREQAEPHKFTWSEKTICDGRFEYAGPTICMCHGQAEPELAENCIGEVKESDVLFAWIDRMDTSGTLVEIGAAHAFDKPVFVAFASTDLAGHFYFAKQLATASIVVTNAIAAWH